MRFIYYLKDKLFITILNFLVVILIFLLLNLYNIPIVLNIFISFMIIISYLFSLIYLFFKKRNFYKQINNILSTLDKKYFISEMIEKPNFFEGELLTEYLYEINKSYIEELNRYKFSNDEFKEYIELWCHEIKTPIATSKLIIDNNRNKVSNSILEELERIEQYIEQVLFFFRSENVEKDYLISKINLKDVFDKVIIKNKKDFINKKIRIESLKRDIIVESDSKWLEFIIGQILINSIKYSKDSHAYVNIVCEENKNNTILKIEDNGIGIKKEELSKVFDKGFTGSNGRMKYNSTGIGLYLCKKLCDKLNHSISISSVLHEKTIITIVFPKSSMISAIE